MILKTFSVFSLSFVSVLYYNLLLLFDNGVTATIKIPDNIQSGESVTAEVIINKDHTGGFAKLQIETGQGLSIEEMDSKGATFSFSGNTAKWIWTALPMEAEFKVKFKVTASAAASGTTSISGKFSYIVNNAKQVSDIPSKIINIGSTAVATSSTAANTESTSASPPTVDTNKTADISVNTSTNANTSVSTSITTTENTVSATASNENTNNVTLNRTIQKISSDNWLISIIINKSKISGFARYSDVLPNGLTAKAEEKDGSSFFVDGNSIKFVWSNLPEKETIKISYKLSGKLTSPVSLNGDFSYTENNQVLSKTLSPETIQPTSEIITANTPTTQTSITNVAESSTQARQTSVFFSVQLGAFLKSHVGANYFVRKHNISNVKLENHETYKKFYSGNFDEYKSARDYREEIKTKGIQDAFVIAHKNSIRITVQEALMITNQKWYP